MCCNPQVDCLTLDLCPSCVQANNLARGTSEWSSWNRRYMNSRHALVQWLTHTDFNQSWSWIRVQTCFIILRPIPKRLSTCWCPVVIRLHFASDFCSAFITKEVTRPLSLQKHWCTSPHLSSFAFGCWETSRGGHRPPWVSRLLLWETLVHWQAP